MFLIIKNWIHPKNEEGLIKMLNYLNWEYNYGTIDDINDDKWKIIYSSSEPLDFSKNPNKLWIFGPHFCMYNEEKKYDRINVKQDNLIFIQPSQWAIDVLKNMHPNLIFNMKILSFPVNTDKFNEVNNINQRTEVLIYYKSRKMNELEFIVNNLNQRNINNFRIFSYKHRYDEGDFINYLKVCKYGIVVDAHESQGFAIEEMLSCNVPLLVWDVKSLNQEEGFNHPDYYASSIPYWDERCGEYFYNENEFNDKYKLFIDNLDKYKPREFILENLSTEKCAEKLKKII